MLNSEIPETTKLSGAPLPLSARPSRRILVVEDDRALLKFNAESLTSSGYTVDVAGDGAVAWDTLQLNRYDLMVTDNEMPKVTGVELMEKIHGARIVLLIILATGTLPDFTRFSWPQPAATLLKPYTSEELLNTVMLVLGANDPPDS